MANTNAMTKKDNAGALSTINLRGDSGRGSEEIKSDDMSYVDTDFKNPTSAIT
jgi:hypothetical protein